MATARRLRAAVGEGPQPSCHACRHLESIPADGAEWVLDAVKAIRQSYGDAGIRAARLRLSVPDLAGGCASDIECWRALSSCRCGADPSFEAMASAFDHLEALLCWPELVRIAGSCRVRYFASDDSDDSRSLPKPPCDRDPVPSGFRVPKNRRARVSFTTTTLSSTVDAGLGNVTAATQPHPDGVEFPGDTPLK